MFHVEQFDIIVIGGGHAGLEAVSISSQFKDLSIALVTLPNIPIASAPCNPSIGGVGKGQVVRELDALGGAMPELADRSGIQYRILNESKGYAVQSTRVQIDKDRYAKYAEEYVSSIENLCVIRSKVSDVSKGDLYKVKLESDHVLSASKLIVTVGTFLNGKIHTGSNQSSGGRIDCEKVSAFNDIFQFIKTVPSRFKTGTPARLDIETIDFSKMEEQPSDSKTFNFSHKNFVDNSRNLNQVSCYLTRTNLNTLSIIRENKEKSPMYNGQINAVGARYCPSIEDKAYRYPDKNDHHVFVEPEGLNTGTVYPSGISSSLPVEVQDEFIRTIPGLEECKVKQYGYAVEYDVVDTTLLSLTLEHQEFEGLYFAGQVNGTSGYEEAAGQGYIAGVNAALSVLGRESFILSRRNSYIGVMIEDLVSNTRDEPYRLFTARSENRLEIREDNAYLRLGGKRLSLGLDRPIDIFINQYLVDFDFYLNFICDYQLKGSEFILLADYLKIDRSRLSNVMILSDLLRQSWLDPVDVLRGTFEHFGFNVSQFLLQNLAITIKYEGYINRSADAYNRISKLDNMKLDWKQLSESSNISFECKQRILKIRPSTFGQLRIIKGIRPATLAVVAGKRA